MSVHAEQVTRAVGIAYGTRLREAVAAGEIVRWSDVGIDEGQEPIRLRREMEPSTPAQGRWIRRATVKPP